MLLDVGAPNAMIGWWGVGSDEGLKAWQRFKDIAIPLMVLTENWEEKQSRNKEHCHVGVFDNAKSQGPFGNDNAIMMRDWTKGQP